MTAITIKEKAASASAAEARYISANCLIFNMEPII